MPGGTNEPAVFRLELLGPAQLINIADGKVFDFQSRKVMCLLALLAMTPEYTMSREKLASFLWDPAPEEQARGSLRQCLKRLRNVLGPGADQLIDNNRSEVRLIPDHVTCDLWELTKVMKSKTAEKKSILEAVALWRGDILANGVPRAPIFEASLQVERSRLKSLLTAWLAEWLQSHFTEFD